MEILIIIILSIVVVLFFAILFMLATINQTMILFTEAMSSLTKAQKSSLSYLQKLVENTKLETKT